MYRGLKDYFDLRQQLYGEPYPSNKVLEDAFQESFENWWTKLTELHEKTIGGRTYRKIQELRETLRREGLSHNQIENRLYDEFPDYEVEYESDESN